jgi:hypothetical protein
MSNKQLPTTNQPSVLSNLTYIIGLQFDPDSEHERSKVGILEDFFKCLLVL